MVARVESANPVTQISHSKIKILNSLHRELSIYWVARSWGVFQELQPKIQDRLLDIGCGSGLWILALAHRVRRVVGLDLDQARVREAKQKANRLGYANTDFVIASATALPFKQECFDKITCIDVLDNIPEDGQVAQEIGRVLSRAGRLAVTVLLKDRRHFLRPLRFPEHIRNYTQDSLIALLTSAGLQTGPVFYFYHAFSTVLWELATISHHSGFSTLPGIGFLTGLVLSSLARLDRPSGRPGAGVGMAAFWSTGKRG